MNPLTVTRLGFAGTKDGYDGPEDALSAALEHMERNGRDVVSVSVLRSARENERYEAFVVHRAVPRRAED